MAALLSKQARYAVLFAAFGGLLFDGVELGLMPVASLSVSESLLGVAYTPTLGGEWFARFTAALMLGAAVGGILLGNLGDAIGRKRALGISILSYSVFAGLGAFVQTQEQMLVLRFLVGLGVGGVWPNAVALAAECWPDKSRPTVAGLMGVAINAGILLLSQVARVWSITPDSWRRCSLAGCRSICRNSSRPGSGPLGAVFPTTWGDLRRPPACCSPACCSPHSRAAIRLWVRWPP